MAAVPVLEPPGTLSKLKKKKKAKHHRGRNRSDSKSMLVPDFLDRYCSPAAAAQLPRFCAPVCGAAVGSTDAARTPSRLQLWWRRFNKDQATRTMTLLCLCIFSVATCQNIIAPNLTAVAAAYNITSEVEKDAKMGGQLATAFFVFSMPAFLAVGYYTDRWDRRRLLLIVVASNALATFLTSMTTAFAHLFVLRTLSGATVMSILPIAYSVLGDLFPPKTRGAMSTWLVVAMGAGVMLGQLMSGLLGPTVGWRATFVIASLPGFAMSAAAFWFLEMPKRGEVDAAEARRVAEMELANMDDAMEDGVVGTDETDPLRSSGPMSDGLMTVVSGSGLLSADDRSDRDSGVYNVFDTTSGGGGGGGGGDLDDVHIKSATSAAAGMTQRELLCKIFQTKSNILLFAQCIPGSVPWGVLFVFMNDFLAQEKGLSVEQATGMISLFGIGAAVGGVLGGIIGQKIYNHRPRNISLFMGGLQVFAVPLMWRIIDAEYTTTNLHANVVICLLAGVLASMAGTNVRFLLTNVNSPATRGFVMSIFDVFNNIGKGLGPLIVSWLVRRMGSRRIGYDMSMAAWWLDGAFMAATFFFVEHDERVAMGKGRKPGKIRGGRRDS